MTQMCPHCSRDNPNTAQICSDCQEPLRNLLGKNTRLDNRYQVTQVLGYGGFGAVYLAEDTRIQGRQVAIKENRPDPLANPQAVAEAQQQFRAEVNVMINLRHSGLPNVSDQFTGPAGSQYMVMDYIEGETLADLVEQQGALPEAEVVGVAKQLLDVLEYLHSQKPPVFHRDVKPANIKKTPTGQIVLVDFGIAKVQGRGTQNWARGVGSPGFAPLEQYGQAGTATDARSDIYGLGAVMYYMLTGQEPPTAPELAAGTPLTPPRKLKPQLSPDIQRVVFKAMAVNKEDRFQSVNEMRQALLEETTPTTPLGPSPPPKNLLARFATIGGIGAALTCLILIIVVALNTQILSSEPTPTPSSPAPIAGSGETSPADTSTATPTKTAAPAPADTWTPTSTPPKPPPATFTPSPSPTATATPNAETTVAAIVHRYSDEIKIDNVSHLDSSTLSEALMDPVLEKQKRSACWLRNEGLYYTYSNRSFVIENTTFEGDDRATVLARIGEDRRLLKRNGDLQQDYGHDEYRVIYQLQRLSDRWYIYCFQALADGDPFECEVEIEGENPCE